MGCKNFTLDIEEIGPVMQKDDKVIVWLKNGAMEDLVCKFTSQTIATSFHEELRRVVNKKMETKERVYIDIDFGMFVNGQDCFCDKFKIC